MFLVRTTSSSTAGVNATLADNQGLYVADAVTLASNTNAVNALFDHHGIYVLGGVFGATSGIVLGTLAAKATDIQSDIWIGPDGSASGGTYYGITSIGAGITLTNEGSVFGGTTGLNHLGNGLVVTNAGTIAGEDTGIYVIGTIGRIYNFGEIISQGIAIRAMEDTTLPANGSSTIGIENYGVISGDSTAFESVAVGGADVFTTIFLNHGTIQGRISFADGNDLYDGHDGSAQNVYGYFGDDTLIGGPGRDLLYGDYNSDSLEGGGGNDLLVGGTEADVLDGGEGDDVLRPGAGADAIEGGAGRDMLDYAGSGAVKVDLASGEASGTDAQDDVFSGIEMLGGGNGNDVLYGDALGNGLFGRLGNDFLYGDAGVDVLAGEGGNDTLVGGNGVDVLRGGLGADVFRFGASHSGAPGQVRDRIADFSHGEGDRIDLAAIDANPSLPGEQAFAFIGAGAFTQAGQVRAVVVNGLTSVSGQLDAPGSAADFSIVLNGAVALAAADFIL